MHACMYNRAVQYYEFQKIFWVKFETAIAHMLLVLSDSKNFTITIVAEK